MDRADAKPVLKVFASVEVDTQSSKIMFLLLPDPVRTGMLGNDATETFDLGERGIETIDDGIGLRAYDAVLKHATQSVHARSIQPNQRQALSNRVRIKSTSIA